MTSPLRIAPTPKPTVLSPLESLRAAITDPCFQGDVFSPSRGDKLFYPACQVRECNREAITQLAGGLCTSHRYRFRRDFMGSAAELLKVPAPDVAAWLAEQTPFPDNDPLTYSFEGLPALLSAEIRLCFQEKARLGDPVRSRSWRLLLSEIRHATSVFDLTPLTAREIVVRRPPAQHLPVLVPEQLGSESKALLRDIINVAAVHHAPVPLYDRDVWFDYDWGIARKAGARTPDSVVFRDFHSPAIRQWAKDYAQHLIRGRRLTFSAILNWVKTIQHFDRFLAETRPDFKSLDELDREVALDFITWVQSDSGLKGHYANYISAVATVIQTHNALGWTPTLQPGFKILRGEGPRGEAPVAKPLHPRVVNYLMSPAFLNSIPRDVRNALVIARYCGLRVSSISHLAFDPLVETRGGLNLKYFNEKRQRVPLLPIREPAVVKAIEDQQAFVRERFGREVTWLFPALNANPNGDLRKSGKSLMAAMTRYLSRIDVRDEKGNPLDFEWNRMRDTVATELLNAGHDPWAVARWLDHKDLQSLPHYGEYHADTLRKELDDGPVINRQGVVVYEQPRAPDELDADVLRKRLERQINTVPGGGCNLPAREACPTPPLPCYGCNHFGTGPSKISELLGHFKESQQLVMAHKHQGREKAALKELEMSRDLRAVTRTVASWMRANPAELTQAQRKFMEEHAKSFDEVLAEEGTAADD